MPIAYSYVAGKNIPRSSTKRMTVAAKRCRASEWAWSRPFDRGQDKARLLLARLASMINGRGVIKISHEDLAETIRCSVATIKRALNLLERKGYLAIFNNRTGRGRVGRNTYVLRTFDRRATPDELPANAGELAENAQPSIAHPDAPATSTPTPTSSVLPVAPVQEPRPGKNWGWTRALIRPLQPLIAIFEAKPHAKPSILARQGGAA